MPFYLFQRSPVFDLIEEIVACDYLGMIESMGIRRKYSDGCMKPQYIGGIYRINKINTSKVYLRGI